MHPCLSGGRRKSHGEQRKKRGLRQEHLPETLLPAFSRQNLFYLHQFHPKSFNLNSGVELHPAVASLDAVVDTLQEDDSPVLPVLVPECGLPATEVLLRSYHRASYQAVCFFALNMVLVAE